MLGENHFSYGQIKVVNESSSINNTIPQEKLFVHINSTFLLTGEHFYYKIYSLNSETNKLSYLSKIAYVELISSDKNQIFKHKVRLESGIGQGDFFIPTSVQSGNYKLIAYTQWMRNKTENKFFQNDISIVNPFSEDQKKILKNNAQIDSLQVLEFNTQQDNFIEATDFNTRELVALELNNKNFKSREKVVLKLLDKKDSESFGNYSISVRKIAPINVPNKLTSTAYFTKFSEENNSTLKNIDSIFLPELRGELLSGKVMFKDSKQWASNVKVALSIPGKDFIFKIATTNDQGVFYFNIDNEYQNSNAILQIISNDEQNLEIEIAKPLALDYGNLTFNSFLITEKEKDFLLEHSVYNQIQNAYSNLRSDAISSYKPITSFYGTNINEYILDNYTRFPTINETIIEVIDLVFTRQNKGVKTVHIVRPNSTYNSNLLPLILLDGRIIQDHNKLVNFDANKVEKISVVRENYIYGSQLFNGIISIKTIKDNYKDFNFVKKTKSVELFKPLQKKRYFKQEYDGSDKLKRIPDYRNQLLWMPNLEINSKTTAITFFTSDNKGNYEISIEGFTKKGHPVSLKEVIVVE